MDPGEIGGGETAGPRAGRKAISPWIYAGCGCALLAGCALVALVLAAAWFGREVRSAMRADPRTRAEKVRSILPYRELPPGYYPAAAFSVPAVVDYAILSDRDPGDGPRPRRRNPGFRARGFIYFRMTFHLNASGDEGLRRWIDRQGGPPRWFPSSGRSLRPRLLGRGSFSSGEARISFISFRNTLGRDGGRHVGVIATGLVIQCPNDHLYRKGTWFAPDPAPGHPAETADLDGTPADPKALAAFASHFQFCQGR